MYGWMDGYITWYIYVERYLGEEGFGVVIGRDHDVFQIDCQVTDLLRDFNFNS